jgi:hypothetical protein
MTGSEAAAYLGLTPATFSKWVADRRVPQPLPGTRRWDRKAIDLALDKASGIVEPSVMPEEDFDTAYARWEKEEAAPKGTSGDGEPWEDKFNAAWAAWLVQHQAWNAEQPPAKRSSAAEVERARQALRKVWKTL